ncbi:hypothetical protein BZA05DRAFT_457562 [Tricharina praecox]|uniref:uncharacterized protein n=1 Tax=Tricharina praecox TaxID=43433 RepID=UPI0022210E4E|nr:uncharacterized protein BZA05DRAFT_457562 [Tricharina praecox]KAI5847501.1 hypothetical protein BZA05DRAFT_457562 [Tricharina praecox]
MLTRYLPEMSPKRYDIRKRAPRPAAAAVKPARNAPKITKAASGISKSGRAKKYIYALKASTMARLADMEFDVHTTLVEGARFYLQPGGRKRIPSGVVSMVITTPAGVDAQWPVELDFEEMDWEAVRGEAQQQEFEMEEDDEEMEDEDQDHDQNEMEDEDEGQDHDQNEMEEEDEGQDQNEMKEEDEDQNEMEEEDEEEMQKEEEE